MVLAAHRKRAVKLGHAGALVGAAVDLDQAFLADAHAAEDAARLVALGQPQFADAGRGQSGGQGLAAPALDDPALEIESDPLAVLNQFPAMSPQRRVPRPFVDRAESRGVNVG